jgi:acyl-CoA reductase-like NAD-dependent aldehyde dehydrogenase
MLTKNIQSAGVFVNEIVKSDPRLPFGGIKNLGMVASSLSME